MGSLLTSLINSAGAMRAFERQLEVVQNNVSNVNTPGYARQTQTVTAAPFDLDHGLAGGVTSGPVVSARSEYAEESVRQQQTNLGQAQQKASDLAQLQSLFDPHSAYGVAGSLSKFFKSFSQLSVNPNDNVSRQSVIDSAAGLAQSINQTAIGLNNAAHNTGAQIRSTVDSINNIAADITALNDTRRQNAANNSDAGIDAQTHAKLEELAQYVNFAALQQADGTFSIYLGGQTPLVVGNHSYSISADFSTPQSRILDSNGADLTPQVQGGQLSALIGETNQSLPSYLTDLNTFARTLSDQVNAKLAAGVDLNGTTPVVDLFSYNATLGEASTLTVTNITPDQIAAAAPGAPGGNANALDLAGLVDSKVINGFSLSQYFGNLGSRLGSDISAAQEQQKSQTSALAQARSLREQVSGVSLDDEAAHLIQIQRAYQAAGKLLTVLDQLTSTVIELIP